MVGFQEVPLKVKNTFIDVDDKYINRDGEDGRLSRGFGFGMRQVSEPVPSISGYLGSQASSPSNAPFMRSPFRPDFQSTCNEEFSEEEEEEEACDEPEAEEFSEEDEDVVMRRLVTGGSLYGSLSPLNQVMPPFHDMSQGRAIGLDPYMPQDYTAMANMTAQMFKPSSQTHPVAAPLGLDGVPEPIPTTCYSAAPQVPIALTAPASVTEAIAPPEWNGTVTVMMRNLPNKYKQCMLMEEINQAGFQGTYDFVYLPIDPETNANKGYAFLNFIDTKYAWAFKMAYEGKRMLQFNSNKFVSVTPATLQGFEANHAHYSRTRVSRGDPKARPLFLRTVDTSFNINSSSSRRRKSAIDQASRVAHVKQSQQPAQTRPAQNAPAVAAQNSVGEKMQVKFCAFCGGSVQSHFRFCQFCGQSLNFNTAMGA